MHRVGIGFVLVAALALPAGASASHLSPSDFKNASKFCKAVRDELGQTEFRKTYGTNENGRNAHGRCVSKHVRTLDRVHTNAVRQCRAELEADRVAFLQKYGDEASASERPEGRGRPEDRGRPEGRGRPEDGGDRGDRGEKPDHATRRALHRCVRLKVRQAITERREALQSAVDECRAELTADPEKFRETYGSNRNKRNAFGKCVSSKVRAQKPSA